MADKDNKKLRVWELPSIKLNSRNLRFLMLRTDETAEEHYNQNCVPLFLGADVLHSCGSYALKNLGRLHSKFALDGLACKVKLPNGYRIKGIRGAGDIVWFYSIQGLFRVAFEYYGRNDLKLLLEKLQNVWLSRVDDPLINHEIVVEKDSEVGFEAEFLTLEENPGKSKELGAMHGSGSETLSPTTSSDNSGAKANEMSEIELPAVDKVRDRYRCNRCDSEIENIDINAAEAPPGQQATSDNSTILQFASNTSICDMNETLSDSATIPRSSGALCDKKNMNLNPPLVQPLCPDDEAHKLMSVLRDIFEAESTLAIIMSYLETFIQLCITEKENIVGKQSTSFPIKLMKDYMELKNSKEIEVPHDDELAIHVLSSWVGEKFFMFKDLLKHNINIFKQENINSISDLPHPEEIIKTIFPSAMYSLVYLWVRGTGGLHEGPESEENARKIAKMCLLVLELLNGSPITGLGHWIYSVM